MKKDLSEDAVIRIETPDVKETGIVGFLTESIKPNEQKNELENTLYIPTAVHLGLYHNIRKGWPEVTKPMNFCALILEAYIESPIVWEVTLAESNEYKRQLWESLVSSGQNKSSLNYEIRKGIEEYLSAQQPRFIWLLRASNEKGLLVDIVVDATDTGHIMSDSVSIVGHQNEYINLKKHIAAEVEAKVVAFIENLEQEEEEELFDETTKSFLYALYDSIENYAQIPLVDELFGICRLPDPIKDWERDKKGDIGKLKKIFI